MTIKFSVELLENDVPIIFGLEHHRSLKYSSNEFDDTFTYHPSNTTVSVIFREDSSGQGIHLYITRATNDVLYTKFELIKLYQSFGHPSYKSLTNLLQKTSKAKLTKSVVEEFEKLLSVVKHAKHGNQSLLDFELRFRLMRSF